MDETAFQKQLKSRKSSLLGAQATSGVRNLLQTFISRSWGAEVRWLRGVTCVYPAWKTRIATADGELRGARGRCHNNALMNIVLFELWLHFFAGSVPKSVQRPLVLILEGCASHYSVKVVDAAAHLSVMLVFLPPNGTHLLQPLDVAVFATLKDKIRNLLNELVEEDDNGYYTISKVASMAWRGSRIGQNIKRGFTACGLFLTIVGPNECAAGYFRVQWRATSCLARHMATDANYCRR
ncbi:hypothetical protein PR001_g5031 [Phytophthora rubi]|uniref:DDE-1 domain-containing protein n=1 Tax=Phytophthora rubi TaxID=129364 RepID=A0A6A3NPX0_9STRA|nr:hypothetical protein PR001_g5031 [Phytophthora rubi]